MPDLPLALQFAWLIPALPFAAFIAVGLGVSPLSKRAAGLVATLAGSRSTWQSWHVRAEAQRQARTSNVPAGEVAGVVDRLVHDAHRVKLSAESIRKSNSSLNGQTKSAK